MDAITLVVLIYLKDGQKAAFHSFERQIKPLIKAHGGRFERVIEPASISSGAIPLPDEIHVLAFDSAEGFRAYRTDPRVGALAPLREQSVADTIVLSGRDINIF